MRTARRAICRSHGVCHRTISLLGAGRVERPGCPDEPGSGFHYQKAFSPFIGVVTESPRSRSAVRLADQAKPALPSRLPWLAVLGLTDPADGDWGRLRSLQLAGLARLTVARVFAHALGAMLMMRVLPQRVGLVFSLGWLAILVFSVIASTVLDRRLRPIDQRRVGPRPIRLQATGSAALAVVWAAPILAFGPWLGQTDTGVVWAIMAMLMAAMGFAFAAVPLGAQVFVAVLGLAGITAFVGRGEVTAAAVAACFQVFVAIGAFETARTFLDGKLAEAGLVDKDDVVSLLLREFEEGDADWLWQVDASRRVRNVSPRFAFALGEESDDIEGKPLIQLIAGDSWDTGFFHSSLHDLAERVKRRESFSNLLVRVAIKGQSRWWELSASPRVDENGTFVGFRGVGSDVTERRESEEQIAYLARFDTLTALPNRLQLTEALDAAMRRLGCRKIQGYYFGRPMKPEDAFDLVKPRAPKKRKSIEDIVQSAQDAAA
eukprot:gene5589-5645_t